MTLHNPPQFLGDLLEQTTNRFPDREGIVYGNLRLTWGELNQRVKNLAAAFIASGIERGDRIGILSTTRPEYLCAYLAAARVGAILVGFNVQFTPAEVRKLAELTQPKMMIVIDHTKDKPVAEPLLPLFASLPYLEYVVMIGSTVLNGTTPVDDWLMTPRPDMNEALDERALQLQPDDGVLIVFTSGSTGTPKAALLTHKSVLTNTLIQAREFGFRKEDRVLQNKPMSHVGGAINLTTPALAVGATLVFMDHFNPVDTLETVQAEQITILGQVPTMFIMELNLPTLNRYDLSSLRLAIVGGAATPVPVMYQILGIAGTVMTGYGMTETGGYITFTHPSDHPRVVSATVGGCPPEYELQIVDAQRKPLPTGEIGEVALRGDCLLREYFANPKATAKAFSAEGWFYSGDVGFLDERGYLTLVDRREDMYISGGYNVYPREIEQYIAQHPRVEMVAVMGTPHDIMGKIGTACVTLAPGADLSTDELHAFCTHGLAEYKIPRQFILLETLPLTSLGKIDKPTLRKELIASGRIAG